VAGDVVLVSEMEHHANIVPWFQLREQTGIEVRFIPTTDDYRLDLSGLDELMRGVRLLSITGMSNVLGTINPINELAAVAHRYGALIAVDGAQSVAHQPTDVVALDVDFLIFTGHKMLGPTGIGVFWTREDILDAMPPFLGGGGMIADVRTDGYTPANGPTRFEAGTPPSPRRSDCTRPCSTSRPRYDQRRATRTRIGGRRPHETRARFRRSCSRDRTE